MDDEASADFWSFNGVFLVRHHVTPRRKLYTPGADSPFPHEYLDVHRITLTSLADVDEHEIKDYWDGTDADHRELSSDWVGTTSFQLVMPSAPRGYYYLPGLDKPIRAQVSSRPEEYYPDAWKKLSKTQAEAEVAKWLIQKPLRDAARASRKLIVPIPHKELSEYYKCIARVKAELKGALSPCMPLISVSDHIAALAKVSASLDYAGLKRRLSNAELIDGSFETRINQRACIQPHREKVAGLEAPILPFLGAATSCTPETHHLLVHQQLSPKEWKNIQGARDAVNAEWDQLDEIAFVDYSTVAPINQKKKEASDSSKTFHFGRVFPLCHIKHSELDAKHRKYKGRCVFGGNDIRDESGVLAIFQEQGASASNMTAANSGPLPGLCW